MGLLCIFCLGTSCQTDFQIGVTNFHSHYKQLIKFSVVLHHYQSLFFYLFYFNVINFHILIFNPSGLDIWIWYEVGYRYIDFLWISNRTGHLLKRPSSPPLHKTVTFVIEHKCACTVYMCICMWVYFELYSVPLFILSIIRLILLTIVWDLVSLPPFFPCHLVILWQFQKHILQ